MGYHFAPHYFKMPECVHAGEKTEFEFCMENCGVAPIYEKIPLKIRIKNKTQQFVFDTGLDIREWLPGKYVHKISIELPEQMTTGKYEMEIGILGENTPMIYFCTDAARDGQYYRMGEILVET